MSRPLCEGIAHTINSGILMYPPGIIIPAETASKWNSLTVSFELLHKLEILLATPVLWNFIFQLLFLYGKWYFD